MTTPAKNSSSINTQLVPVSQILRVFCQPTTPPLHFRLWAIPPYPSFISWSIRSVLSLIFNLNKLFFPFISLPYVLRLSECHGLLPPPRFFLWLSLVFHIRCIRSLMRKARLRQRMWDGERRSWLSANLRTNRGKDSKILWECQNSIRPLQELSKI